MGFQRLDKTTSVGSKIKISRKLNIIMTKFVIILLIIHVKLTIFSLAAAVAGLDTHIGCGFKRVDILSIIVISNSP